MPKTSRVRDAACGTDVCVPQVSAATQTRTIGCRAAGAQTEGRAVSTAEVQTTDSPGEEEWRRRLEAAEQACRSETELLNEATGMISKFKREAERERRRADELERRLEQMESVGQGLRVVSAPGRVGNGGASPGQRSGGRQRRRARAGRQLVAAEVPVFVGSGDEGRRR
jgi:hypothetical protein